MSSVINLGLSVNDVVSVNVSLSPQAAQLRNFGSLLILGDSGVIDITQRIRQYSSLAAVAGDFGTNSPEYQAAVLYFGQTPQPQTLYIGAWARAATPGTLVGGLLSASQQTIANFSVVTSGGLSITINGTQHNVTGVNLSAVSNLNGVAAALQAALAGSAVVFWNPNQNSFEIQTTTVGVNSTITFATQPSSGTDLSGLMGLVGTTGTGSYLAQGIVAETPLTAMQTLANQSNAWYGLMFAASTMPQDADYVAVAAAIQAQTVSRIFGVTTQEAAALFSTSTTDLASLLNYSRTFVQYSSFSPYACAAIFGIAFTVNFNGSQTTITLKFKQEAGVTAETLTETQAGVLATKNCNVFVAYNNQTAILQQGVMSNGYFFDVVHGSDWLQNDIQTAVYNRLYTSTTKIPQTDAGVNVLVSDVTACLAQAVTNGYVAPGVWFGPPIGAIVTGQTLSTGYYVYAPPVATQTQAARAARQAPVISACIKLAGAIHFANVLLSVSN